LIVRISPNAETGRSIKIVKKAARIVLIKDLLLDSPVEPGNDK
jgi:hypothetical protein